MLKPVAGVGTEATVRVDAPEAFQKAVALFFPSGTEHNGLQVEQFVAGEDFCLDGWVHVSTIGFSSVGRQARTCLEPVEAGAPLRIYHCTETTHPGLAAEPDRLAADALTALGLRNGVFHLEFFRPSDGQLVFSECAARRGGAFIEEEVRISRSTSLAAASVDLCLGAQPKAVPTEPACEMGSVHPKLPSGVVLDLPRTQELAARDGVEYVRYYTYLGASHTGPSSSLYQPAAAMLVSAPTLAELDIRLDQVETAFVKGAVMGSVQPSAPLQQRRPKVVETEELAPAIPLEGLIRRTRLLSHRNRDLHTGQARPAELLRTGRLSRRSLWWEGLRGRRAGRYAGPAAFSRDRCRVHRGGRRWRWRCRSRRGPGWWRAR